MTSSSCGYAADRSAEALAPSTRPASRKLQDPRPPLVVRRRFRTRVLTPLAALAGRSGFAGTLVVSMGGCIASALAGHSTVEVVGAILGIVASRAGRALGTVEARTVSAADRPPDRQARPLDARLVLQSGGIPATTSTAAVRLVIGGRAGGYQPGRGRWRLLPGDRSPAGTGTLDGVTGAGPQRRPLPTSSPVSGCSRRPASRPTQLGQAGGGAAAPRRGGGQAEVALVTGTDRRLALAAYPDDPTMRISHPRGKRTAPRDEASWSIPCRSASGPPRRTTAWRRRCADPLRPPSKVRQPLQPCIVS
jgi:hypothetical protein